MSEGVPAKPEFSEKGRWTEILTGQLGMYTLVLNLGAGLFAVSSFVVVAILPTATADIGGLRLYSWTFALFSVGSVIGAAATSPLRESVGHRLTYVGAGVVFIVGLVGAALAPNMESVVFWRLVQGVGGGALTSQGYALIAEMFPPQLRGRALSFLSTAWGVGTILGPTVGGIFAEYGSWRGAFWALGLLGVIFVVLAWRVTPAATGRGVLFRLPVVRLSLLAAAVMGFSLTSQINDPRLRIGLAALGLILAATAFLCDAKAERPMFPRQAMILNSEVGAAYVTSMLSMVGLIFVNVYATFYLQALHGVTPLVAAYIYILNSLSWSTAALAIASWEGKKQSLAIVLGLLFLVVGMSGISSVVGTGPVWAIGTFLCVTGTGMGFLSNPLIQRVIAAAPPEEKTRAGSSVQAIRNLGHAFGAALAGLVAAAAGMTDAATPETVASAMQWVHGVGAMFPLIALGTATILIVYSHQRMAKPLDATTTRFR